MFPASFCHTFRHRAEKGDIDRTHAREYDLATQDNRFEAQNHNDRTKVSGLFLYRIETGELTMWIAAALVAVLLVGYLLYALFHAEDL
jgi:K+-transporting ATPase KdpF subunit